MLFKNVLDATLRLVSERVCVCWLERIDKTRFMVDIFEEESFRVAIQAKGVLFFMHTAFCSCVLFLTSVLLEILLVKREK